MGSCTTLQRGHILIVLSGWDEVGSYPQGLLPREDAGPMARLPGPPPSWAAAALHGTALPHHITHISLPSALLPVSDGNQGNEKEAAKVKRSPGPPERGRAGG